MGTHGRFRISMKFTGSRKRGTHERESCCTRCFVFAGRERSGQGEEDSSSPLLLANPCHHERSGNSGGLYELSLESTIPAVRVTLCRDGRFVATALGAWVKNGAKYTEDSALLRVNSDGSRSLIETSLRRRRKNHRPQQARGNHPRQRKKIAASGPAAAGPCSARPSRRLAK